MDKCTNCFVTTICSKCKPSCSSKTSDWRWSTYKYFAVWFFYWLISTHINSLVLIFLLPIYSRVFFIYYILINFLLEIWQSSLLLFNVLFTCLFSLIALVRLWFIFFYFVESQTIVYLHLLLLLFVNCL